MSVVAKSKSLQEEEAGKKGRNHVDMVNAMTKVNGILPDDNGVYHVTEVPTVGKWFAIVPFAPPVQTPGGIVVPGGEDKLSDSGIVVGEPYGYDVDGPETLIGKVVKFSSRHVVPTELTGYWKIFKDAPIILLREDNIFVVLPDAKVEFHEEETED